MDNSYAQHAYLISYLTLRHLSAKQIHPRLFQLSAQMRKVLIMLLPSASHALKDVLPVAKMPKYLPFSNVNPAQIA